MVAGCLRRVGRLEDALLKYREVGCGLGWATMAQVIWWVNMPGWAP